MIKKRCDMHSH